MSETPSGREPARIALEAEARLQLAEGLFGKPSSKAYVWVETLASALREQGAKLEKRTLSIRDAVEARDAWHQKFLAQGAKLEAAERALRSTLARVETMWRCTNPKRECPMCARSVGMVRADVLAALSSSPASPREEKA